MLTSAPCLTKNLIILIEFALIAILRGHPLISREFHNKMINMKRKRLLQNNYKYQMNENTKR